MFKKFYIDYFGMQVVMVLEHLVYMPTNESESVHDLGHYINNPSCFEHGDLLSITICYWFLICKPCNPWWLVTIINFQEFQCFAIVYIFVYDLLLPKTNAKLVVQHVFIELKKTQCKWMKIC